MKKVKILYALMFIIFLLISVPPLSLLVGLNVFCTESIFVTALGFESNANIYLPISQFIGIIIIILGIFILNKKIKLITKEYDENLENNATVIRFYDKFKIEYSYIIPVVLSFVFSLFSYFHIFKKSGICLLLIIFCGVIELVIAFVVFYNEIQLLIFLKNEE